MTSQMGGSVYGSPFKGNANQAQTQFYAQLRQPFVYNDRDLNEEDDADESDDNDDDSDSNNVNVIWVRNEIIEQK